MTKVHRKPILAITLGDVAGIGPETVAQIIEDDVILDSCHSVVIGNAGVLRRAGGIIADRATSADRSRSLSRLVDLTAVFLEKNDRRLRERLASMPNSAVSVIDPFGDAAADVPFGSIDATAGDAAFHYLTCAIKLARAGVVDAITTAPLNKAALHAAGHLYPGHTEILAEQCGVRDFAMMLYVSEESLHPARRLVRGTADLAGGVRDLAGDTPDASLLPRPGGEGAQRADEGADRASFATESATASAASGLAIAHVTLHQSVASVPGALTTQAIVEKAQLVNDFLQRIGCQRRAIAIAALNPHGGENGLFGDEEPLIIEPAVRRANSAGLSVTGPLPIDTLIRRAIAGEFDGVVAMYHDQGHIPVKLIAFDSAINVTLGLPIIRTSPTHGTAFDIAGRGIADASGLREAVLTAQRLVNGQLKESGSPGGGTE